MALISLLSDKFQQTRTTFSVFDKTTNKFTDMLLIDATISRSTKYENEMTMNPVEDGPDVTDHVRTKPITMTIDGIISETPLSLEGQKSSLTTTAGTTLGNQIGGFKGGFGGALAGAGAGKLGSKLFQADGSPAELGRAVLENLVLKKIIFKVTVNKKFLENMVMTSLSIPEDQGTGYALKFSCTLQQIRIVTGQSVLIEKVAASAAHSAGKKTNLGGQAATEGTKEQARSWFKSITKFAKGG